MISVKKLESSGLVLQLEVEGSPSEPKIFKEILETCWRF